MKITCYDSFGSPIESLTQWDLNRKIGVTGLDYSGSLSCHIFNDKSKMCQVVPVDFSTTPPSFDIPNKLLQNANFIMGGFYETQTGDNAEGRVIKEFRIPVASFTRPEDYVYVDNIKDTNWAKLSSNATKVMQEIPLVEISVEDSLKASNELKAKSDAVTQTARNYALDASSAKTEATNSVPIAQAAVKRAADEAYISYMKAYKNTITGSSIHITDAIEWPICGMTFHGKTERGHSTSMVSDIIKFDPIKRNQHITCRVKPYNLITYPYAETTKVENGITFTDNGDGTITANGTASEAAYFYLVDSSSTPIETNDLCRLRGIPAEVLGAIIVDLRTNDGEESQAVNAGGGAYINEGREHAEIFSICIRIAEGAILNNVVFEPMLSIQTWGNNPFSKYVDVCGRIENIIPYPYSFMKDENDTVLELSDVTLTVNPDRSISVDAATGSTGRMISIFKGTLPVDKNMIISGCPMVMYTHFMCRVRFNNGKLGDIFVPMGGCADIPAGVTIEEIVIKIDPNAKFKNAEYKPMIIAGAEQHPYIPPGTIIPNTTVLATGKNLVDVDDMYGEMDVHIDDERFADFKKFYDVTGVGRSFTISADMNILDESTTPNCLALVFTNGKSYTTVSLNAGKVAGKRAYLTFKKNDKTMRFSHATYTSSGPNAKNQYIKNVQLEPGGRMTYFERHNASANYTLNDNGAIYSMNAIEPQTFLCPLVATYDGGTNTTLFSDPGVYLDAYYSGEIKHKSLAMIWDAETQSLGTESLRLSNRIDLNKWDTVELRDGVWGKAAKSNKIIYTGKEHFDYDPLSRTIVNPISSSSYGVYDDIILCNLDIPSSHHSSSVGYTDKDGTGLLFYIDNFKVDTPEEFIAMVKDRYRAGDPLTVEYATQNEQSFTPLPQEDQSVLNQLKTFCPETFIWTDDGLFLDVTYIADTKTYVDKKFEELKQSLVATGGN